MNKVIALSTVLSVLLTLTACITQNTAQPEITQTQPEISTEATTQSTVETTSALTDIQQLPMLSIALPVIKNTTTGEDGEEIFSHIYQNIALVTPDPEVADKIILDFLNKVDAISADVDARRDAALSAYAPSEYWTPHLCQYTFTPKRIDSGILSLLGTYATFNGTSHPEISNRSVTYSMVTGQTLHLADILVADASADTLYNLVVQALETQKEILYEGYEDTVKERFGPEFMQDEGWFLSEDGLCFYFSPREIAGYVSGTIVAEILYPELVGIMDDSRFPAEQDLSVGNILGTRFDDTDYSKFNQFTEIVLTENAEKFLIYTDGAVRNVRLESGYWNADGNSYTPEFTVLALSSLTPGDAIMVEADIPQNLPALRLTYQSGGKPFTAYISENFLTAN